MALFKRILLALDLREGTQSVVDAGIYLAKYLGSELILFHTVPEIKGSPFDPADLEREASRRLDEIKSVIMREGPFSVRTLISLGPSLKRIVETAEQYDADAIVIGSGLKEPGEKFQLAVTAEQIMRYSHRPVWLVKSGLSLDVDGILCPVDFSDHARLAVEYALSLARTFRVELTVLNVVEQLSNIYPGRPLVQPHEQGSYKDAQREEFERFLAPFDFEGVSEQHLLLQGTPHEEILNFIRERGCHLIVMGSEGKTGLTRLILGSVAEKVIREVPCSVLTVKSKGETAS